MRPTPHAHLVGEGVDPLLQVAIFRVQQRCLLGLEGTVGVGVLPKLADHRELGRWHHKKKTEIERDRQEEREGHGTWEPGWRWMTQRRSSLLIHNFYLLRVLLTVRFGKISDSFTQGSLKIHLLASADAVSFLWPRCFSQRIKILNVFCFFLHELDFLQSLKNALNW